MFPMVYQQSFMKMETEAAVCINYYFNLFCIGSVYWPEEKIHHFLITTNKIQRIIIIV